MEEFGRILEEENISGDYVVKMLFCVPSEE